jgi:predicted O-methyltransferase YrrM
VENRWREVDDYIAGMLLGEEPREALAASEAAGLPAIQVSAAQGKLLFLLARMLQARRILEIGTLGGYSTIWLARALSRGGKLVTLEVDPHHASVAWSNIVAAGVGDQVDLRVGPALESLDALAGERGWPFDLVFIDADKPSIPEYFRRSIELCREGSVIVVDNVVRDGALADSGSSDPKVTAVRQLHELIAGESRVAATTLQTVGSKGYDGFTLAVVDGDRRKP